MTEADIDAELAELWDTLRDAVRERDIDWVLEVSERIKGLSPIEK